MTRDKVFLGIIIVLLLVVIFQLNNIRSKLEYIDWDTRQILGRVSNTVR